uniref:Uncharacterized protein n=1 Tax=Chlamydomonas leiostraca TaxID=1034604 RepID=A0A7S0RGE3_9CHLO|mmetsp:Transcript_22335/g.56841  ORF Transcript_22335/g.56841 Transcript_22335/m.56841 type:complete len:109 (+) Transcript_22335:288-614(+)
MSYLDQEGVFYKGLGVRRGVVRTLFRPDMWILGSLKRLFRGGCGAFLRSLAGYKLTVPERKEQSWQQGGTFVFRGHDLVWSHHDATPGDYPNWATVLKEVEKAAAPMN